MLKIYLVRPGSTEFDEQGRIKGCLDIPLSNLGEEQVAKTAGEMEDFEVSRIYCSPCQSAKQTAKILSKDGAIKVKVMDQLRNLDHGLWHGKLIEELKATQPKTFRQFADNPESTCPPQGETLHSAKIRAVKCLNRIIKKNRDDQIILVIPDPLATIVRAVLECEELGDLWKSECETCGWELIDVVEKKLEVTN